MAETESIGARGSKDIADLALAYTESTGADSRMVAEDIWGSQAHAIMLARQGILAESDLCEILRWLEKAREDLDAGEFALDRALEDVHMNVENYIRRGAGPEVAGRLHTARSRNDQVVTDFRMALRSRILDAQDALGAFEEALLAVADEHAETVMPGYTHLQHAQPITVGFWAAGHVSALARDQERLSAAFARTNRCPLGACALAGTSFPTDRALTAELLGFDGLVEHSLDAVSSRDFAAETLSSLAILMANLSKLAEEIIVWSSFEFGMVELDDAFAFGSSIMPQKKNPCIAELVRARTGLVYGHLARLLTTMKATPSGYNRDLQEDKPPVWESLDCAQDTLRVLREVVGTLKINADRMMELAGANFATATELANFLVRERGLPFRTCHTVVGQLVQRLIDDGATFDDVQRVAEELEGEGIIASPEELRDVLDPERCVRRQESVGSTSPDEVQRMVGSLRESIPNATVAERREQIAAARSRTAELVGHVLAGASLKEAFEAPR